MKSASFDSLCLVLTRKCQLHCPCCPVDKTGQSLCWAHAKRALDWFMRSRSGTGGLVKFAGGEPLLNFPVLRRCVRYALECGFEGEFEVATSGRCFTGRRLEFFAGQPRVRVHISAPSAACARLPNAVANMLIEPVSCAQAPERLLAIFKTGMRRVNVLPAYFVEWESGQLRALEDAFRQFAVIFTRLAPRGLELENIARLGPLPLFNTMPTIDTDGKVYPANIILAAFAKPFRSRLCAGHITAPQGINFAKTSLGPALLGKMLSPRALASTRRVDALLDAFVEEVALRRGYGACDAR